MVPEVTGIILLGSNPFDTVEDSHCKAYWVRGRTDHSINTMPKQEVKQESKDEAISTGVIRPVGLSFSSFFIREGASSSRRSFARDSCENIHSLGRRTRISSFCYVATRAGD